MKLAFLFSAYTDAEHLLRLIRVLPEGSESFIHVDAKSDISQFATLIHGEHVHYLDERYNVVWGSYSQTQYQMALIRAALHSGMTFDYLITMSGMEYPVWSQRRIALFIEEQRRDNRQLLQAICMTGQSAERQQLYRWHWPLNNIPMRPGSLMSKCRVMLRKGMRVIGLQKPLEFDADGHHYLLYKGSDWFGITPELAAFVLHRWDHSPQLRAYFRDSFTPSETAIHTIALNSDEFGPHCLLHEGPYTSLYDLTPLTYISYVPGTVDTLDEQAFDAVLASGRMFCRKVVTGKSNRLMQMLDEHRAADGQ